MAHTRAICDCDAIPLPLRCKYSRTRCNRLHSVEFFPWMFSQKKNGKAFLTYMKSCIFSMTLCGLPKAENGH